MSYEVVRSEYNKVVSMGPSMLAIQVQALGGRFGLKGYAVAVRESVVLRFTGHFYQLLASWYPLPLRYSTGLQAS